jgi:hypothetical protein
MNEAYALLDADSTDNAITTADVKSLIFYNDHDADNKLNKAEFLFTVK